MVKYLLVTLTVFYSAHLLAQKPAIFEGKVATTEGETLPGITIVLLGTTKDVSTLGAVTDSQGNFSIAGIPPGPYKVHISGVGYEKQKLHLAFYPGQKFNRSITLIESISELDEVVVTAESEARALELSAKAVQVIETRGVKLKSADLGEVMARTEGVNVQRAGGLGSQTRFSLNGLSDDQIRFFHDGIPLEYTPYAFGIANVPVNAIHRVEIYKGVVPIQFGADALGGAVNLASPKVQEGLAGAASYQVGTFNTHRVTGNINYASQKTGLFVMGGGFYDFTDNNYKLDVAIPNEEGRLQQRTVRRFHDGYRAYGTNVRLGILSKKWANELSLEGYYGDYYNEIQNSQTPGLIDLPQFGIDAAVGGNPFGEVQFTSVSKGVNLNYEVNLGSQWEVDLTAGYNYNERVSIDTSRNVYNWFGQVVAVRNQAGEFGAKDHFLTLDHNYFARQQVSYSLSEKHVFRLAFAPTYSHRTGDDLLVDSEFDPALDDRFLFNVVTGLEYRSDWLKEKLQTIAFVKNYQQNVRIESKDAIVDEVLVDKRAVSNFGAGVGLRHNWTKRLTTKLSYEYAYRLPRPDEIFGDGQLITENLELRPENSHNVNFQTSFINQPGAKRKWEIHSNLFLRRIDDLILLLVDPNGFGLFANLWSANSEGIELGGSISNVVQGLTLSVNSTYQQYLNTSNEGSFAGFKGDRIPNTPYFFANAALEYELTDLITKQDKLSVFWDVRYVNSFFVGWESAGLQQFKAEVPNQTMHAAGLTHRANIKKVQNAITLEVQNLTNAKVFDLFGVQRPGRAFYIK
ncbi:MAG: TonB-dependent receptor plug domain-containing protein, partial [Bacteroidota bacterium]